MLNTEKNGVIATILIEHLRSLKSEWNEERWLEFISQHHEEIADGMIEGGQSTADNIIYDIDNNDEE